MRTDDIRAHQASVDATRTKDERVNDDQYEQFEEVRGQLEDEQYFDYWHLISMALFGYH